MILSFDNAESILDPQGTDAHKIYATMEELSQFDSICLCIKYCISAIPPTCETLDISVSSMVAVCNTYCIYKNSSGQFNLINDILGQLDFHPLSITPLPLLYIKISETPTDWPEGGRNSEQMYCTQDTTIALPPPLNFYFTNVPRLGPDVKELLHSSLKVLKRTTWTGYSLLSPIEQTSLTISAFSL